MNAAVENVSQTNPINLRKLFSSLNSYTGESLDSI